VVVNPSVKVFISDGRKVVREALAALLEKQGEVRVVGEANDTDAAIKLLGPLAADVVVLVLPQARGAAEMPLARKSVSKLLAEHPKIKIVVLAMEATAPQARRLIEAGAAACLTKESASHELLAAIRAAVEGKAYVSEALSSQSAKQYVELLTASASQKKLATRETEVLRRIAMGQSTKEIAFSLHVGRKTIETHRRRIMDKLSRHSIAELTQYAVAQGLVSLPEHV
jgi:DNA-binding NarL/FixJ family response regulator